MRECIASIYENTRDISFEIIVVDNASPQGDVETILEQFRDVKIIKSLTNVGFAKANNIGFAQSTGSYVLFLNPDTQLLGPTLNILLEHMKSLPDAGIVGCKMLNTDRTVQITSIQRFPTILNQVLNAEYLQLRWPNCPLWSIGPLFSRQDESGQSGSDTRSLHVAPARSFRASGNVQRRLFHVRRRLGPEL